MAFKYLVLDVVLKRHAIITKFVFKGEDFQRNYDGKGYLKERLQACSHYCDDKKGLQYLPDYVGRSLLVKLRETGINLLKKTKLGFWVYRTLQEFKRTVQEQPLDKFCPNNNLGVFITASCNLKCFNCQTSASQAPSSDLMTVEQVETIVREAISLKYYWSQIIITGGEATLHPQLLEILEKIKKYQTFNPECKIFLETNGVGDKVKTVLNQLPDWVLVNNSNKEEGEAAYDFLPYNMAPIDDPAYNSTTDFTKGCKAIVYSYGLCASMYGYFPSSPCMNIARVFGFELGIQRLSDVTDKALRSQMETLCRYCGWFGREEWNSVSEETRSASWERALQQYQKRKTGHLSLK